MSDLQTNAVKYIRGNNVLGKGCNIKGKNDEKNSSNNLHFGVVAIGMLRNNLAQKWSS